jgi:hypothetical protein
VPSSARPPAPTLRYLMPTSRWLREGTGTAVIRSSRRGGGVRAFIERPWFVSGDDEQIAVLAWSQPTSIPPAVLRHISVAGRDPIWDTGKPQAVLSPANFYAEFRPEFLPECAATVSAVVHAVKFDAELDCWYADIDLSPLVESSYFPFVRFGLARYQANTVDSRQRLSPPIVSEPMQLLPHRELTAAEDALIGPAGWTTIGARKTAVLGAELQADVPQAGSRRMRILVTETESYPAPVSADTPVTRLVYADTIDVTT